MPNLSYDINNLYKLGYDIDNKVYYMEKSNENNLSDLDSRRRVQKEISSLLV